MKITKEDEEGIDLLVPAYRVDVQRPCDVVEDILRIYGYNNVEIPSELKSSLTIAGDADKDYKRENIVSEQLVGEGFNEILNNSLTKTSYYEKNELNKYTWDKTVKRNEPIISRPWCHAPDAPLRRTREHRPQYQPQGQESQVLRGWQLLLVQC